MENPSEKFPSQGVVSTATGLPGGLYGISMGLNPHPLGDGGNNESSFADIASQRMVGFGMGQIWALNEPLKSYVPGQETGFAPGFAPGYEELSDDDKKWAEIFYKNTEPSEENEESGLFNIFKTVARGPFCGKVCKSLGYMRREDKTAFKKCKASCATVDKNFQKAKQGKWNYPPAPEGIEPGPSPAQIAADAAKEAAATLKTLPVAPVGPVGSDDELVARGGVPAKSNMMMYIIIGVVALILIIAIIMLMRRRTAAK